MDRRKDEWFATWFDSPLYHILYKQHNENEAKKFLDLLIDCLPIHAGAKILDLGCGRGRFAKYLGSKNFDVLGIDLSQNSIDYAKQFEQGNLHFEVHDMRDTLHPRKFHYVLNLFTSFGYFSTADEDRAVLRAVRKSLSVDGSLIIDFINGDKVREKLVKEEVAQIDGQDFFISRWIENEKIYKKIVVNGDEFREEVKLLSLEQFNEYAAETGFSISEVYGDYQLNPYQQVDSDRLIMVFNAI
ncbi:MAG: class I SAM-dependent methyltransferase [Flavobacteriales bacterium]|nr:class I SAM-dependent methyltransferase [Flavobacteriales bacterium]